MSSSEPAQFVMKISKYCNLRCGYCYEFSELGNKERMSLETIERIFRNLVTGGIAGHFDQLQFVWHGGEPFLIPLEYYDAIGALQREIFGGKVDVCNTVQTNLTVLTDRHIEYLKGGRFFSDFGVSCDVYGGARVDRRGRSPTQTVLANLQRLLDADFPDTPFTAIAVLACNTLPYVREIARFFAAIDLDVRFLPFDHTASDRGTAARQTAGHGLRGRDLVDALNAIFDEWLMLPNPMTIEPINDYLDFAVAFLCGERIEYSRRNEGERVFIVNTDGGVWGMGEEYVPENRYGTLVSETFGEILASPGRRLTLDQAERRRERFCARCPYDGFCPGVFVQHATPVEEMLLAEAGCPVKAVIDHMITRLEETGIDKVVEQTGQASIGGPASRHVGCEMSHVGSGRAEHLTEHRRPQRGLMAARRYPTPPQTAPGGLACRSEV